MITTTKSTSKNSNTNSTPLIRIVCICEDNDTSSFIKSALNSVPVDISFFKLAEFNETLAKKLGIKTVHLAIFEVSQFDESLIAAVQSFRLLDNSGRRIPVLALCSDSNLNEKSKFLLAGIDDLIYRDEGIDTLRIALSRWIKRTTKLDYRELEQLNTRPQNDENIREQYTNYIHHNIEPPVDKEQAIKRANHKVDLARDMLKMLLESLPQEIDIVRQAEKTRAHEKIYEIVHRIHGACCYCGVPQLQTASSRIDLEFKAKRYDIAVQLLPNLYFAIETLVAWGDSNDLDKFFGLT